MSAVAPAVRELVHIVKKEGNVLIEKSLIEILKPRRHGTKTLQSPLRYVPFSISVELFGALHAT